jgi:glycosyltransferase involved in cell wall biosynthesis
MYIETFGLDVVSFPVWDLEAFAALDDLKDVAKIMSLHTTYGLAKPFKPEWSARPIYEANHINLVLKGEEAALREMPLLLANSDTIMDQLEALHGIPVRDKSVLIPHGTEDPSDAGLALAAEKLDSLETGRPLKVLYVGRFEPRKGFDLVVDAIASLLTTHPDLTFSVVGDVIENITKSGGSPAAIEAIQEAPQVAFKGFVSREELEAEYASADILLAPSRFESFGLIGIEAMAVSTPVVALKVGGLAEVITEGSDGLCVPPEEGGAGLAEAVAILAADRSKLKQYMKNARASFEKKYTADLMVDRIADLYTRLAAEKKGQSDER